MAVHRVRSPRGWIERRLERRRADEWIAHGFGARYAWRVSELTSIRERKALARSLRSVVGELEGRKLPGPTPLRSAALRPHLELLNQILDQLSDPSQEVAAAGIVAVHELLSSPGSVLYAERNDVGAELDRVLHLLEEL
jgi:hypothetical protein